jgi:hypothetical protein
MENGFLKRIMIPMGRLQLEAYFLPNTPCLKKEQHLGKSYVDGRMDSVEAFF